MRRIQIEIDNIDQRWDQHQPLPNTHITQTRLTRNVLKRRDDRSQHGVAKLLPRQASLVQPTHKVKRRPRVACKVPKDTLRDRLRPKKGQSRTGRKNKTDTYPESVGRSVRLHNVSCELPRVDLGVFRDTENVLDINIHKHVPGRPKSVSQPTRPR
jgi:hypothetical protein